MLEQMISAPWFRICTSFKDEKHWNVYPNVLHCIIFMIIITILIIIPREHEYSRDAD